jgi:hypothetical protein
MWEKVAKRSHRPIKIFSFGPGSDEVMLYGTVDYELKDGKKAHVEWGGRSHFTHEDGELKMDLYQVYLVSTTPGPCFVKVLRTYATLRILPRCPERSDHTVTEQSRSNTGIPGMCVQSITPQLRTNPQNLCDSWRLLWHSRLRSALSSDHIGKKGAFDGNIVSERRILSPIDRVDYGP